MNDNQCLPSRAEQINYDPNCDLTAKSSHVGHHTIVDSNAKKLPNIMDRKSPLQAHNKIIDSYIHTYIKFYLDTLAPTTKMLVSMGGVRTELQIHGHIVCKRRNTHMHTSN